MRVAYVRELEYPVNILYSRDVRCRLSHGRRGGERFEACLSRGIAVFLVACYSIGALLWLGLD